MKPPPVTSPTLHCSDRLALAEVLLAEGHTELARLNALTGSTRSHTARRLRRALVLLTVASGMLGLQRGIAQAVGVDPIFALSLQNPDLSNVGVRSSPDLADLDGDGDLDALVGASDGNALFFRNTGTAAIPAFATASTNPFGLTNASTDSSPDLADLDGDGDLDALFGSSAGNSLFFRNTGTAAIPAFATASTNPFGLTAVGFYSSPDLADLDGDGDLDALVGVSDGNALFFRNTGTAALPAFATPSTNPFGLTSVGYANSPELADVNGDGDLDALVGSSDGNTIFFRNSGTAALPAFATPSTNPFGLTDVGANSSPNLADLDGDGDLDALVGASDGSTRFFRNSGTAITPAFAIPSGPFGLNNVGSSSSPELADLDGDGDLDALIGALDGYTRFFRNTGTATLPAFATPSTNPFGITDVGDRSSPDLADLDGDGDLDALVGASDGKTRFFRNSGTAALPAFATPSTNPFGLTDVGDRSSPELADLDGDGDLDALVGAGDGNTVFFRNSGTAALPAFATPSTNPFGLSTDVGFFNSPDLADLDGDGDLDALFGAQDGNALFFRNSGTAALPAFATPSTNPFGLTNVGLDDSPVLADLDGDGDLDALVGSILGDLFFFKNVAPVPPTHTVADFDGNGSTDRSVWRPSTGQWFVKDQFTVSFGLPTDQPVPGDFDGNGTADLAVFRPSTGQWFVKDQFTVSHGLSSDIPVPADYDGDGDADVAVWRPSTGQWFVKDKPTISFGLSTDIPVPGDYNNDKDAELAVYRPSTGQWFIDTGLVTNFGLSTDIPVPGDFDGNGSTDIAVWRPSTGQWFIKDQGTTSFGLSSDIPVQGDYDDNGSTDIAVFRRSTGQWFVKGLATISFGLSSDVPAPLPAPIKKKFFP